MRPMAAVRKTGYACSLRSRYACGPWPRFAGYAGYACGPWPRFAGCAGLHKESAGCLNTIGDNHESTRLD